MWVLGEYVASRIYGWFLLPAQKKLCNDNAAPFPWQHNSPKGKVGNESVNSLSRSHVPKQQEEIHCKWKIFFFLLCWLNRFCLRLTFFSFSFLKLWANSSTTQYPCQLFYGRQDTPCAILSQKCMLWERGLVKLPQPVSLSSFFHRYQTAGKHVFVNLGIGAWWQRSIFTQWKLDSCSINLARNP